jgi:hypothetical protein
MFSKIKYFYPIIFTKRNLYKILLIFFIGFVSRFLINYYYNINVLVPYINFIFVFYYFLVSYFILEINTFFNFLPIIPFSFNYYFNYIKNLIFSKFIIHFQGGKGKEISSRSSSSSSNNKSFYDRVENGEAKIQRLEVNRSKVRHMKPKVEYVSSDSSGYKLDTDYYYNSSRSLRHVRNQSDEGMTLRDRYSSEESDYPKSKGVSRKSQLSSLPFKIDTLQDEQGVERSFITPVHKSSPVDRSSFRSGAYYPESQGY